MSVTTPIGIEFSPPSAHTLPEFGFLRRFTLLKINDLSHIFCGALWLAPDFAWSDPFGDRSHFHPTGRSFDQGKSTCRGLMTTQAWRRVALRAK
jgi:hypothetical protein